MHIHVYASNATTGNHLDPQDTQTMITLPYETLSLESLCIMFKSFTRLTKRSIGTLPRCSRRISSDSAKRQSDPLRILFCGSDEFSCASLQALHDEHKKNTRLVESLEVMVLPPKRTGRGFRTIREGASLKAQDMGAELTGQKSAMQDPSR